MMWIMMQVLVDLQRLLSQQARGSTRPLASLPVMYRSRVDIFSLLEDSLKRESGAKVHKANIQAAKAVADIIRTTLGPRSMLKMLLDAGR
ncbi:T-complex protein 1 subunit gamma [Zea mays]|uniref:T-complex protein 1 subunit gamma n=1 Tax=Zea mays TaxID=4577 RepID=UPI0009A98B6D|nr:T-complex protein 1 subunit gamma [Zea mays]|eukprot:XP_020403893.1 T-complex protein 1 subunit gamma [Zea mays]